MKSLAIILLIFSYLFLGCSDDPQKIVGPGGGGNVDPIYIKSPAGIPIVPGVDTNYVPDNNDVRLQITSEFMDTVTFVDTIAVSTYNSLEWGGLLDTLSNPLNPNDPAVVVWRNQLVQIDTNISLNESGVFSVVLKPGDYKFKLDINGNLQDLYNVNDTVITSTGGVIVYIPNVTVEPHITFVGRVLSALDSTPLFNRIEIQLGNETLIQSEVFETDSLGNFIIPFVDLQSMDVDIISRGLLNNLYLDIQETIDFEFQKLQNDTLFRVYYMEPD